MPDNLPSDVFMRALLCHTFGVPDPSADLRRAAIAQLEAWSEDREYEEFETDERTEAR